MSKSRRTAVHRVGKQIEKHEGACQREHVRMQTDLINAFLHAVGPWFDEEDLLTMRRAMKHDLARRQSRSH